MKTAVDVSEEWAKTFVKIMKHKRVAIWVWFDYRDCESSTCCDFLLHCPNTNEWDAEESDWKLVRAIDQDWNALRGKKKEGARVWPGTSHPQWDGQFGKQLEKAVSQMKENFRQK